MAPPVTADVAWDGASDLHRSPSPGNLSRFSPPQSSLRRSSSASHEWRASAGSVVSESTVVTFSDTGSGFTRRSQPGYEPAARHLMSPERPGSVHEPTPDGALGSFDDGGAANASLPLPLHRLVQSLVEQNGRLQAELELTRAATVAPLLGGAEGVQRAPSDAGPGRDRRSVEEDLRQERELRRVKQEIELMRQRTELAMLQKNIQVATLLRRRRSVTRYTCRVRPPLQHRRGRR